MAMEDRIKQKLEDQFQPSLLVVENESHKHAGHAGSPGTGESHFKIQISSSNFSGQSRVEIHKAIYGCLDEELKSGIHALSIQNIPDKA